jgi:hypothetical protein
MSQDQSTTERFPALATDGAGQLWLAVLERPVPDRRIVVYTVDGALRRPVTALELEGLTGIGPPAIAALDRGCVVVFPVEVEDRWRIAYLVLGASDGAVGELQYIPCEGNANIVPDVAVHRDRITIVWESNRDAHRAIYAVHIDKGGPGKIVRLSDAGFNSYNPAVVALPDGDLFAAWDSFRDSTCNIWGARCINGQWRNEQRITSGRRLERHPFLAVRGDEVWVAWQAQSYKGGKEFYNDTDKAPITLNYLDEQRIVVARLDRGGLQMPVGMFEQVSTASEPSLKTPKNANLLQRPTIAFDAQGALWLTVRQSIHLNGGWRPTLWQYSGESWDGPHELYDTQGRWQAIPLTFQNGQAMAALQTDDLPRTWDNTKGMYREWRSEVHMKNLAQTANGTADGLRTVPLTMPETDFSLEEKRALVSAEFPRKKTTVAGVDKTLFFGDFHEHTDLSVCQRAVSPPGKDLYANLRDIEQLDFCGITDHGYNFDAQQWQLNGEQTRNNYDPGKFVTFLAEEWTSSNNCPSGGYGHHNLVFLDPYHDTYYDAFDGNISPTDLWQQLEGTEFISIPHQLADWRHKGKGNPPKDWAFFDEKHMPLAEIYQTRQSYEYLGYPRQAPDGMTIKGHYMQDAWAKGIIIGTIASPDHGGGHGKIGVWANALTRKSLFEAFRARHTFGTSGAKMELLFRSGDHIMGDKVEAIYKAIDFEVQASALHPIEEVVIFRNNKMVFRETPGKASVLLRWTDDQPLREKHVWYYARIHASDNHLAWSSPIWFLDNL